MKGRKQAALIFAVWFPLVLVFAPAVSADDGQCASLSVDEIIDQVSRAHRLTLGQMQFKQNIHLQSTFLSWDFTTDVAKRDDNMEITVHNGPWFLPKEFKSTLVEPVNLIEDFEFQKGPPDKSEWCVLQGVRQTSGKAGPSGGVLWIDPGTWLLRRADAKYWWSQVTVTLDYGKVQGHTVVVSQNVVLSTMATSMEINNHSYVFK